jgi:hypothetical protein
MITAVTAIGTFTKKNQRQLSPSDRNPPTSGPSDRLPDRSDGGPHADADTALRGWEGVAHDRQRIDEEHRGAEALNHTRGDQPPSLAGDAGQHRSDGEGDESREQHLAPAVDVA